MFQVFFFPPFRTTLFGMSERHCLKYICLFSRLTAAGWHDAVRAALILQSLRTVGAVLNQSPDTMAPTASTFGCLDLHTPYSSTSCDTLSLSMQVSRACISARGVRYYIPFNTHVRVGVCTHA